MKFSIACITALSVGAYALPHAAPVDETAKPAVYEACKSLGRSGSFPACCEAVHLGLISLNCTPMLKTPASKDEFGSHCASSKTIPRCCWLDPARGTINSICQKPVGF
ncbi:hypothetical protein TWF506_008162 [Arthrobotrys conoides]|uniref:Cerato-ulmin n=1 Tax=Arthrobotrys conoides TaxID=74498 RepID=A0AAN8RXZ1_9PEZI